MSELIIFERVILYTIITLKITTGHAVQKCVGVIGISDLTR